MKTENTRYVTFTRESDLDTVICRTASEHKTKHKNKLPDDWNDYVFQMQPNEDAAIKHHNDAVDAWHLDTGKANY